MSALSATIPSKQAITDSPLGPHNPEASSLLKGLDVHTVKGADGHPLTVFGIESNHIERGNKEGEEAAEGKAQHLRPILLLHGRTWSSIPVFHLMGNSTTNSRSTMEAFLQAKGLQPYAMDFRGFGGTPSDDSNKVYPHTCVSDVESVLQWITERHNTTLPALLGWSQGALVAQLVAQKSPALISKLVLYGSIYDPLVSYPRAPLYAHQSNNNGGGDAQPVINTFDGAIEDFTIEGSIPPEPAKQFAHAALLSDPMKAQWTNLHEFNNLDPARVHVPTLVIAGDQDPYAPLRIQQDLFCNLGRGCDRSWSIISGADHAVHLLDGKQDKFVKAVKNFVENGQRGNDSDSF